MRRMGAKKKGGPPATREPPREPKKGARMDGQSSPSTLTRYGQSTLTSALHYAAYGWCVIPIHPQDKRPLIKWGTGASINPAQIHTWFTQWPEANIALKTGVGSSLAVVDIDSLEGWKALQEACLAAGEALPLTRTIRTARGVHLYFRISAPQKSLKISGLELKADKTYVLAPPSLHPSGVRYSVLHDAPLADLPQFIIQLFQTHASTRETQSTGPIPSYLSGLPRSSRVTEFLQNVLRHTADAEETEFIKSKLEEMSADCPRDAWIKIGMFLKDYPLLGSGGEHLGLDIWDAWSQKSKKENNYPGRAEIETQWNSLHGRPLGEGVGIGTFFYLVEKYPWGWEEEGNGEKYGTHHEEFNGATTAEFNAADSIVFDATAFATAAPRRRWFSEPWMPADQVTLFAGDGGMGKSTVALQLAIAAVSQTPWFGMPVRPCNVLYASAEDDRNELHWRFQEIAKHTSLSHEQRQQLKFFDLTQADPVLIAFDKRNGKLIKQPIFERVEAYARDNDVHCIILDAAADMFGGSEIDRIQVRAFLASLRAMAQRLDSAVILISHPSVAGMKDDRGYSGSTAWNATVRARLWFKKYETGPDHPDTDLRVLELRKANRAEPETKIIMRWHEGRYVATSADMAQSSATVGAENTKFIELMRIAEKQNKVLSDMRGHNYAPIVLARFPSAKGYNKEALERAMHRELEGGKCRVDIIGPPSRQQRKLVIVI